jgi:hypothetical protein
MFYYRITVKRRTKRLGTTTSIKEVEVREFIRRGDLGEHVAALTIHPSTQGRPSILVEPITQKVYTREKRAG